MVLAALGDLPTRQREVIALRYYLDLSESEIADAQWFRKDAMPMIPPEISIAGKIIQAWLAEE